MNRHALIVFGRNPVRGTVKTRLGAELGPESAVALYRACLLDTLHSTRTLDVDLRLYLAPTKEAADPAVKPFDDNRLRQRGRGLGPRMSNAFDDTFAAGYERVVMIGSDIPNLPASYIESAFDMLVESRAVVLGPALDGGYYLVGLTEAHPEIFHDISYTRENVLSRTLARCALAGLRTATLDPWYDVDTFADVRRLAADLKTDEGACPNTRSLLSRMGLIENTSSGTGSASEMCYFGDAPKQQETTTPRRTKAE